MKTVYFIIPILLLSINLQGQQLSRNVIATAGDSSKNKNGASIEWTIGEVFSQNLKEDHHITCGFQQGELKKRIQLVEDTSKKTSYQAERTIQKENHSTVSFNIFPNPTVDLLSLSFEKSDHQNASVFIFNESGHLVIQQDIDSYSKQIKIHQVSTLSPGIYFFSLSIDDEIIKTLSFVKI